MSYKSITFNPIKINIIYLIIIASFGPLISNKLGIGIEHITIYSFFIFSIFKSMSYYAKIKAPIEIFLLLFIFINFILWTSTVTLFSDESLNFSKFVGPLENNIQPVALIFILIVFLSFKNLKTRLSFLENSSLLICIMLCLNSLVSISEIFVDTWSFVKYFVRFDDLTQFSVWTNAASMGRYSGIFNQPFEAGLAYSVGLGAWLYRFGINRQYNYFNIILILGIVVGGMLTVSKVFIAGGIPLAILYFFILNGLGSFLNFRNFFKILFVLLISLPLLLQFVDSWSGFSYFSRLFNKDTYSEDFYYAITAGRFGTEETQVQHLFNKTYEEYPLYGFGFGHFPVLDNGYLAFFYQGGFIGLILYLSMLSIIFLSGVKYSLMKKKAGFLLLYLSILIIGADFGAPVLTINRSSILMWILVVLCFSILSHFSSRGTANQKNILYV